jgi:hypothetical protein
MASSTRNDERVKSDSEQDRERLVLTRLSGSSTVIPREINAEQMAALPQGRTFPAVVTAEYISTVLTFPEVTPHLSSPSPMTMFSQNQNQQILLREKLNDALSCDLVFQTPLNGRPQTLPVSLLEAVAVSLRRANYPVF